MVAAYLQDCYYDLSYTTRTFPTFPTVLLPPPTCSSQSTADLEDRGPTALEVSSSNRLTATSTRGSFPLPWTLYCTRLHTAGPKLPKVGEPHRQVPFCIATVGLEGVEQTLGLKM